MNRRSLLRKFGLGALAVAVSPALVLNAATPVQAAPLGLADLMQRAVDATQALSDAAGERYVVLKEGDVPDWMQKVEPAQPDTRGPLEIAASRLIATAKKSGHAPLGWELVSDDYARALRDGGVEGIVSWANNAYNRHGANLLDLPIIYTADAFADAGAEMTPYGLQTPLLDVSALRCSAGKGEMRYPLVWDTPAVARPTMPAFRNGMIYGPAMWGTSPITQSRLYMSPEMRKKVDVLIEEATGSTVLPKVTWSTSEGLSGPWLKLDA